MQPAAQTLQTKRLRLRWLTLDDAPLLLAIWNDPAFIRHVGDRGVRTLDQARQAMHEGVLKLYSDHGYGPYRVSNLTDDEAMGICGLFQRDHLDAPDIGFGLLPEFCGQGYAGEAALAVMDHARNAMGLACVTAIVSPGNQASIGLIRKLGLRLEKPIRMPGEEEDVLLYSIRFTEG